MKYHPCINFSIRHWIRLVAQVFLVCILLLGIAPYPAPPPQSSEVPPQLAPLQSAQTARRPAKLQTASAQSSLPVRSSSSTLPTSRPSGLQSPTTLSDSQLNSAYVRDLDLGDGRRQAIVSTAPINYQAADGSWQPIDPRFEAVAGGFLSQKNSLVIGAAERQASLSLRHGQAHIAWEPQALVLAAPGGNETVLARPLDHAQAAAGATSSDGLSVLYPASWSLASLSEQVTAGPGQVEESLVVASLPLPQAGEEEKGNEGEKYLALQATLLLPPDAQLYANGAVQSAAFTTTGQVQVRDAQGQTALALATPRAFEQANPGVAVTGRYRLTPDKDNRWQVAVETPWAWWADPARAYPAVLDPSMLVLQPFEAAEIYSEPCTSQPVPPQPGEYQGPTVGVGNSPYCGIVRSLVRFNNLPTLPPGYEVQEANLTVTPVRGYYPLLTLLNGEVLQEGSKVWASLYAIGQPWDPNTVNWDNQPAIDSTPFSATGPMFTYLQVLPPVYTQKTGTTVMAGMRWTLQTGPDGLVSKWLQGGDNDGLELRDDEEGPCTSGFDNPDCHFVAIPRASTWTSDNKSSAATDGYINPINSGAGFALSITYTPPALDNETPVIHTNPLLLPTQGEDYLATFHSYRPPPSASWMAVGVKGLDEKTSVQQPNLYYEVAGNLGLGYKTVYAGAADRVMSAGEDAQTNYLVFPGNASALVDIHPPAPKELRPANANLDTYMVEASQAISLTGNPTFAPNTVITQTFQMSSNHILKVFDLNLVENTRVSIKVIGGTPARVFPPQGSLQTPLPQNAGVSMYPYFKVPAGQGGKWGLVLDYSGPVSHPEWSAQPANLMTITVRIRACSLNAVPTDNGCEIVNCPVAADCHTVEPYKICSDAGFDPGSSPGEWTSRMKSPGGTPYATCIGWNGGSTDRWVTVNQGPVHFFESGTLLEGSFDSIVSLASFSGGDPQEMLPLWEENFVGYPNAGPNYGLLLPMTPEACNYTGLPLGVPDRPHATLQVNVQNQYAEGEATLLRPIETSPGLTGTFNFLLQWQVWAEGYGSGPLYTITPQSGPAQAGVSSLTMYFDSGWTMDFDTGVYPPAGQFTTLRNVAKIAQPADLGSAWKTVQAVILSYNEGLPAPGGPTPCLGYCMEPRALDDSQGHLSRTWQLPDVDISGSAQTIASSSPGRLVVYSSDHPNAINEVSVPFSFRFLEGAVTISKGPCPGGGSTQVTLIEGKSKIIIPGIGSGTEPPMIEADFTLCETSLREIRLTFDVSISGGGIPVGNTGVFIDSVSGTINAVASDHTTVNISIHYKAGADAGLLTSDTGDLTVDTRGLFDMQTTGKVLGLVTYDGHAWVAWNPLDVGVDVQVHLALLFTAMSGQVRVHAWQGQGWQNKYHWLPNDNAMHMAGGLEASFTIPQGAILSEWWAPDIPPGPVNLAGIDLAFGQFCGDNCGCKCYEWGVKGTINAGAFTFWQDVGLYYGFSSGLALILGSDGYTLVDQYALSADTAATHPQIGGKPANLRHTTVADPLADTITTPITITAFTGSALVGLGNEMVTGTAALTLIRPGGVEISPTNAASYGITVTENYAGRLYAIRNPLPGIWQAKISNSNGADKWHLLFLANKKMPQANLLTPAILDQPWITTDPYNIQWSVPPSLPAGVDVRISLYYSVTNGGELTPTQRYGGIIRENLPITSSQYSWNMSHLAGGTYRVYARVGSDGSSTFTPRPTLTDTNQLPGVSTVWAPGRILLRDVSIPQVPINLKWTPMQESAKVCWDVVPDRDLAGYVLEYIVPDVDLANQTHHLRIHATVPFSPTGTAVQCARIGGLNNGIAASVQVASYDATGNVSHYGETLVGESWVWDINSTPAPGKIGVQIDSDYGTVITWTGIATPGLANGYQVYYALDMPAGPGVQGSGAQEGDSPIDVGNVTSFTLHGLQPGSMAHFSVRSYWHGSYDRWWYGPLTVDLVRWVTNGVDGNSDGMPDDWALYYRLVNPADDPDRDSLTNAQEFQFNTYPRRADSDHDGFTDGEEYAAGSDPQDGHSLPAHMERLPHLWLDKTQLTFRAGTASSNPPDQWVQISNVGGGGLTPTASAVTPWLTLRLEGDRLWVGVNKAGLPSGRHTGAITVSGAPGSSTQNSPQTIAVTLWLYEGSLQQPYNLYLPLVLRNP